MAPGAGDKLGAGRPADGDGTTGGNTPESVVPGSGRPPPVSLGVGLVVTVGDGEALGDVDGEGVGVGVGVWPRPSVIRSLTSRRPLETVMLVSDVVASALFNSAARSWAPVRPSLALLSRPSAPITCGEAIDVPV